MRQREPKRVDPFYLTPQWRTLRAFVLKRDGHRCVVCGADVSAKGAARVDHIKPRSTHPELALEPSNLRTLCVSKAMGGNGCDSQGHREKRGQAGGARDERFVIRGIDAAGMPLDPKHPWHSRVAKL